MSDVSVELIAQNLAATFHMIFVSVCVGGVATDATLYTLLATDFIINNYFAVITWRNFTQKSLKKFKNQSRLKAYVYHGNPS